MKRKGRIWLPVCAALLLLSGCGRKTAAQEDSGSVVEPAEDTVVESAEDAEDTTVAPAEDAVDTAVEPAEDTENMAAEPAEDAGSGASLRSISILGDSISTFEGWVPEGNSAFFPQDGAVQDVSQTWWKIVLDEAGLTLCANGSSSGSTCSGDSESRDVMVGCSDYRVAQLTGTDGEIPGGIIVYMGTNDVVQNVPVGDNDGTGRVEEGLVDTFSDAYTLILDKLEKQYPSAQIYCCTLLQLGDWGTDQPFVPFVNGQGLTSEAYSDRIRTIAEGRGIPVIDLYHCGIVTDNLAQMTSDGVHLTPEGMRCVADAVLKKING